jgi:hypothetical protein
MSIIYQYRLRNQIKNMSDYFKNKWKAGDLEAKNFYEWLSSIDQYVPDSMDGGLFAQTGNSTAITNTTTETTMVNGGVGALFVPANNFRVGDSFIAYMHGDLSSLNNATLRVRVKANNNTIADTGTMTLVAASNNHYEISIHFTVREVGAAGTAILMTCGSFNYNKSSNNVPERIGFDNLETASFDTTIDNVLNITAQWGSASASNSIDTHIFNLYKIF